MITVDKVMTEDLSIPVPLMMEHAGLNLAKITYQYAVQEDIETVLIVAGKGNNGGGGIVAARRLVNWIDTYLWLPKGEPQRNVPKNQLNRAKGSGVNIINDLGALSQCLVVDAYIGYNFRGDIRDEDTEIFNLLRNSPTISLDLPSGVDSNTGNNPGQVNPLGTVTLAWPKEGMFNLTSKMIGNVFLVDIGVPKIVFDDYLDLNVSSTDLNRLYNKFSGSSYFEINLSTKKWNF